MEKRKIAVIDEDKKILGEVSEILDMGGYMPIVVDNSLKAIESVIEYKPDVILMEFRMPRKSGFEVANNINRVLEPKRVPIIAMSTYFKEEFRWLLNLSGVKRHIKKPLLSLDIFWAIENEIMEADQVDCFSQKLVAIA